MGFLMGNLLTDVAVLIVIGTTLLLLLFNYQYKYWGKKKVPFLKPRFPYGNLPFISTSKLTFGVETKTWYEELKKKGAKFGGVWTFARPVLVLVDPEYVRDILSKDFHHFINRDFYTNKKDDPVSAHLFTITSEGGWKNLRQKLTPTFTSGKMKMMFDGIVECSTYMTNEITKRAEKKQDVDILETLKSFTTDVIGNVAFGVKSNSFETPDTEFRRMAYKIFEVSLYRKIKFVFASNFPELAKKLRLVLSRKDVILFFDTLVKNAAKYREANHMSRPDFLQLLIDLKNKSISDPDPFTFVEITSNTILFFIAGFDTSSTTMNYVLYELARHPDIQEKVRKEIDSVLERYDGNLTYDSLSDMIYLKQVIDESLRLHPAVLGLARVCTEDYKLRDTDIVIDKGTPVAIPVCGLHMDPQYYPDPEKFDPDRFSADKKAERPGFTHLPFGEGPRNCIGLRFGIMQSKIGLITILRKFRVSISPSTKTPLTVNKNYFLLRSNETLYLKFEKI